MGKKNNGAANGKKTQIDIEKLDRYISRRSDEELKKLQIKKSAFFCASVALLIITMFLPSDSAWHALHGPLVSVFSTLNIIGLIYALYLLYQDNRKHKIKKVVLKSKAPHFGYNKFTFLTYEIFVLAMLFFVAEQSTVVYFARDGFAIAGLGLMVAAFAFALVSRFILVNANSGFMELIEAEPKEEKQDNKEENAASETAEENNKENESEEEAKTEDDDFYSPVK